jgi:hypothetical protein
MLNTNNIKIKPALMVTLGEIIEMNRLRPDTLTPDERKYYRIYEVSDQLHIVRVLAKDELDAYQVYLKEYGDEVHGGQVA